MKRKTIDTSREVRLWLVQVIAPIAGVMIFVPEVREWTCSKFKQAKERIKDRINR